MKSTGKRSSSSGKEKRSGSGSPREYSKKGSSPKSGSSRFGAEPSPRGTRSRSSKDEDDRGSRSGERPVRGKSPRDSRSRTSDTRRSSSYGTESKSSRTTGYSKDRSAGSEEQKRGSKSFSKPKSFDRSASERPQRSFYGKRNSERGEYGGERTRERSTGRSVDRGDKRTGEFRRYPERQQKSDIASNERPRGGRKASEVRLNKFLSNAGIASRREADKLIELGLVTVNGKVITELGHKVDPAKDVVRYDSMVLKPEPMRYVLLNKPKDYMTTLEETDKRKSVMALIDNACQERIYPVGRLDRQTTGLLLFTNDGEIAKRLTNPRNGIPKLYHVETHEKIKGEHLDAFREGVELEDGLARVEDVAFVNDDTHQIGMRIHSGRSRIVRNLLEHFGYTIKKLDRVMYAGLTKKDLQRGRYRHLTEKEVNFLRMIR
jgi:23S rRNA pseudouridine2605 synthase